MLALKKFISRVAGRLRHAVKSKYGIRDILEIVRVRLRRVVLKVFALRWIAAKTEGVSRHLGIRILFVTTPGRIGHEQFELDTYFRSVHGDDQNPAPRHHILLFPKGKASNRVALMQWKQHLRLIELPAAVYEYVRDSMKGTDWTIDFFPYGCPLDRRAEAYEIFAKYGDRPAFLTLTEEQTNQGRDLLKSIGIGREQWFVCVHCRSEGYSKWDDHLHSYRNSPVGNYIPAMEAIVEAGGICFRMGGPETPPLPEIDGVFDYAHSDLRSEFMDMFLCGSCRFFLGSSSGLFMLAQAFGRPSALADMTPIGAAAFGVGDLFTPKLVGMKGGEPFSFEVAFSHECSSYRFSHQYEEAGLEVINNTSEEIRDLARNMLRSCEEGELVLDDDDLRRQRRYSELYAFHHYGHGHGSRIDPSFLRKHQNLLLSESKSVEL